MNTYDKCNKSRLFINKFMYRPGSLFHYSHIAIGVLSVIIVLYVPNCFGEQICYQISHD
jgi:hypothetical protein